MKMRGNSTVDPVDERGEIAFVQLAQARDECPVAKTREGFWLVSRYDDVLTGVKAVDHFVSSFRSPGVVVPEEEKMLFEIAEHGGPGFAVGEPDGEHMGDELQLPPWLEERRRLYEWSLTPVPTTEQLRAGIAVAS